MTSRNPYEPPKSSLAQPGALAQPAVVPALGESLCTSNQLFVASLLGGPIAAAWLARTNFDATGQNDAGRAAVGWSIGFVVLMVGIAVLLSVGLRNAAIAIGYSIAIRMLAEMRFGAMIKAHQAAGGLIMSWWRVIGLALLFVALMAAGFYIVLFILMALGAFAS